MLTISVFGDPLNPGREIINVEIISIISSALLQPEIRCLVTVLGVARLVSQPVPGTVQTTVQWGWGVTFTDRFSDPSSTCAGTLTPPIGHKYLDYLKIVCITCSTAPTPPPQLSSPHCSCPHTLTCCTTYCLHRPYHLPRACAGSCTRAPRPGGWSTTVSCMTACTSTQKTRAQTQAHTAHSHQRTLRHILKLSSFPFQDYCNGRVASSSFQILY